MKRTWITVFIAALILSFVADYLLRQGHGELPWSRILGFFALFGFVCCVAIVIVSKLIGHYWLKRKEDYYDRNDSDE